MSLDFNEIDVNQKRLLALRELQDLQHFHFAANGTAITVEELKLVELCVHQLPKLKTVGRELKFAFEITSFFEYFYSMYHKMGTSVDRVTFPAHPSTQLALEEFAVRGHYWRSHLVDRLPKLKRLHIREILHPSGPGVPHTVSELGLYFISAPQRLQALSSRLRVLCLYDCDLRQLPTGGVLALCPNLEVLHLHLCDFTVSDIALNVDMGSSKLRVLTANVQFEQVPDGWVSTLLHAPLLERVQIAVPGVPIAEAQHLVEQVRAGRILQHVRTCHLWGANTQVLEMAVQAFCPVVESNRWTRTIRPPFVLIDNSD